MHNEIADYEPGLHLCAVYSSSAACRESSSDLTMIDYIKMNVKHT